MFILAQSSITKVIWSRQCSGNIEVNSLACQIKPLLKHRVVLRPSPTSQPFFFLNQLGHDELEDRAEHFVPQLLKENYFIEQHLFFYILLEVGLFGCGANHESLMAQSPTEKSARQPQDSGVGLTHACTPASARVLVLDMRISRHSSRSLSQAISNRVGEQLALGAQPLVAAKACCSTSVRLQIGELAHVTRPYNSHFFVFSSARTLR